MIKYPQHILGANCEQSSTKKKCQEHSTLDDVLLVSLQFVKHSGSNVLHILLDTPQLINQRTNEPPNQPTTL